jgi:hypothetical protein
MRFLDPGNLGWFGFVTMVTLGLSALSRAGPDWKGAHSVRARVTVLFFAFVGLLNIVTAAVGAWLHWGRS